jgi:CBS domain-containing protein
MDTLGEYVRRGGEHFVPLDTVPVVSRDTNLSDALGTMRDRGTAGVLVHEGQQRYRLLLHQHLTGLDLARPGVDPSRVLVAAVLDVAPVLPAIDTSRPRDDAWTSLVGDAPFRSVAIIAGTKILGLYTEAEDWRHAFYTTPTVYQCALGHNWPPPPPASCPVDGSSVSGS